EGSYRATSRAPSRHRPPVVSTLAARTPPRSVERWSPRSWTTATDTLRLATTRETSWRRRDRAERETWQAEGSIPQNSGEPNSMVRERSETAAVEREGAGQIAAAVSRAANPRIGTALRTRCGVGQFATDECIRLFPIAAPGDAPLRIEDVER